MLIYYKNLSDQPYKAIQLGGLYSWGVNSSTADSLGMFTPRVEARGQRQALWVLLLLSWVLSYLSPLYLLDITTRQ